MRKRCLMTMCLVVLAVGAVQAQQKKSAPLPKPADNGPSLEVTMKFIEGKPNSNGSVTCTAPVTDTATGLESQSVKQNCSTDTASVAADPEACHINFHRKYFYYNGGVRRERDYSLDLRHIEDVSVMPVAQFWNRDRFVVQGISCCAVSPDVFALWARSSGARFAREGSEFFFYSEELANRVAKAVSHAVELCGGGSEQEPF